MYGAWWTGQREQGWIYRNGFVSVEVNIENNMKHKYV